MRKAGKNNGARIQLADPQGNVLLVSREPSEAAVRRSLRHQQMYCLSNLYPRLQDHLDERQRPGVHAVEQRRDQTVWILSARLGRESFRETREAKLGGRALHRPNDLRSGASW